MSRLLTPSELYELRGGETELLRLAGDDPGRINRAIDSAEGEVISYLNDRYGSRVPSGPAGTPAVLKALVAIIAHRRLVTGAQVAPALVDEYLQATTFLSRVARGGASLDLPGAPAVDRSPGQMLSNSLPPAGLSREALEGM